MTKVASASALCTLNVAAPLLEKDILLHWVVKLTSSLQLTVKTKKKGSDLSLHILEGSTVLKERNAILRALCGMALHNSLDHAPYYLMGGHAEASRKAASPISALAMAGISSWQSIADTSVRSRKTDVEASFLESLNTHLETRAFLVPAASCTLADLDLALALTEKGVVVQHQAHVQRWLRQCHATLLQHNTDDIAIPELLPTVEGERVSMPVFFHGTEDLVPPTKVAATTSKKAMSSSKAPGAGDQSQKQGGDGLTEEQKQAAAEKRAKKAAAKQVKKKQPQQQAAPAAELDISALDIRVGKITKVWHHEEAEKLFCEEVDVGEDKPRNIASGLRPFYKLEDLQDRVVLVLSNLKARNLVGFPSHGMVLCASNDDHSKVEFVVPPEGATIGERIKFDGVDERAPEAENKVAKKKMFEKLAPDLKTDENGNVVWKTHKAVTSAGGVKALNGMPNAHVS